LKDPRTHALISTALKVLHGTRLYALFEPRHAGVGSILMFHRVVPSSVRDGFAPNLRLEVQPDFFEDVIHELRRRDYDIVSLTEARRRLLEDDTHRRFAVITFDDGYRDNFDVAFPICKRLGAPMTIFVTTGFIEGRQAMWWFGLEAVLKAVNEIAFEFQTRYYRYRTRTTPDKYRAFRELSELFMELTSAEQAPLMRLLGERAGVDFACASAEKLLTWQMITEMDRSGLVEFGAHTDQHLALSSVPTKEALADIERGRELLQRHLTHRVAHLAYPYGREAHAGVREFALSARLDFDTAVTTRHGTVSAEHKDDLHALPRLSMNGHHQDIRALRVFLSGASAVLAERFGALAGL
jgi:peptidoglycan/xylan/chitin deacetylase (PgdA/CDA1 family)